MSAQHTPGPWQVNHNDRTQVSDASDVLGCAPVAYIARRNRTGRSEDYANARLIAAAPEGFALAEEFLAFARSGAHFFYPPGALQKLEAYVAKVRGGSDANS